MNIMVIIGIVAVIPEKLLPEESQPARGEIGSTAVVAVGKKKRQNKIHVLWVNLLDRFPRLPFPQKKQKK